MTLKIGIFGGTFDPPHIGHTSAADAAAKQLGLERLIFMPACIPPHKKLPANAAMADDRFAMTVLAASAAVRSEVSDMEIRRSGASYTVDTVREFRRMYPNDEIYLLIGTDMLTSFELWREYQEIMKMAVIGVFSRSDSDTAVIKAVAERFRREFGANVVIIDNDAVEISSTQLRDMLCRREGREYLSDEVYGYIISKRLYGARPDPVWLRKKAYEMLKPRRVPHVAGCEEEAARLAERWGADVGKAREAGILHDITKRLELGEQLLLCEKYGIMTDNAETEDGKLLHSKTGAAVARDVFGVDDEVYNAILWHTTGRRDMSLMDKIIYMADYIEPTRDFEGVDRLRELAYKDIDAAMLLGLEMSLEDLRGRGITPHPRTADTMEWLAGR